MLSNSRYNKLVSSYYTNTLAHVSVKCRKEHKCTSSDIIASETSKQPKTPDERDNFDHFLT